MSQLKKLQDNYMHPNQNLQKEEPKPHLEDRLIECEIRVASRLSKRWVEWFEGLVISYDDHGNTLLSGVIADQAALFGLLNKIRDLNLTLISIIRK